MPTLSPAVAHHRAKIAALSRDRLPDDPELVAARQNLAALRLEEHVCKVLAAAPRPTDEQLQRIAALLRAGGGASPPTPAPQPASGGSAAPSKGREAAVAERIAELDGGGR